MEVAIATGGTAGHVFPAIALARRLEERGAAVTFIGTRTGQEHDLIPSAGFRLEHIDVEPIQDRVSVAALRAPLVVGRAVRACRPLVKTADRVVGMGGYASVPAVLAASSARRRVIIHEQNAVPGLANRLGSRFASVVALTFEEAAARLPRRIRTVVTGNPVRPEILEVPVKRAALAEEATRTLGLRPDRKTVMVFGGSQGALHLDEAIVGACGILVDRADLQILILAGPSHAARIEASVPRDRALHAAVLPFLDRMELALACSDLAVARAGASSICDLAVSGLPSILVPYPHATENHQEANARALEREGAAEVILDRFISGDVLAARIDRLISDESRRKEMGSAASAWAKPDADIRLADLVMAP